MCLQVRILVPVKLDISNLSPIAKNALWFNKLTIKLIKAQCINNPDRFTMVLMGKFCLLLQEIVAFGIGLCNDYSICFWAHKMILSSVVEPVEGTTMDKVPGSTIWNKMKMESFK